MNIEQVPIVTSDSDIATESECIYGNNECCNLVICLPNEIRFRFAQNVVGRRKCATAFYSRFLSPAELPEHF